MGLEIGLIVLGLVLLAVIVVAIARDPEGDW